MNLYEIEFRKISNYLDSKQPENIYIKFFQYNYQ